jgi:hypothetical protein
MFGLLWLRALTRVRASVCERVSLSRHLSSTLAGVDPCKRDWVLAQVVLFQAAVRRRQAVLLARRMHVMAA